MKLFQLWVLSLLFLNMGCREKELSSELDIINANFLEIVDTLPYKYGQFLPAPNMAEAGIGSLKTYSINVSPYLTDPTIFKKDIEIILNDHEELPGYSDLFTSSTDHSKTFVGSGWISNHGRYSINYVENMANDNIVGFAEFSRVIHNEKLALFITSIRGSDKIGLTKLILLKKDNNHWVIVKQLDIIKS